MTKLHEWEIIEFKDKRIMRFKVPNGWIYEMAIDMPPIFVPSRSLEEFSYDVKEAFNQGYEEGRKELIKKQEIKLKDIYNNLPIFKPGDVITSTEKEELPPTFYDDH